MQRSKFGFLKILDFSLIVFYLTYERAISNCERKPLKGGEGGVIAHLNPYAKNLLM